MAIIKSITCTEDCPDSTPEALKKFAMLSAERSRRKKPQSVTISACIVILLFSCACSAFTQNARLRDVNIRSTVDAISVSADNAARRQTIIRELEKIGIEHRKEDFTIGPFSGVNIVATVAGAQKPSRIFLLGAYYDRVSKGEGALDNASGCAALLSLLAKFKAAPLKNYTIKAIFFDLEKEGRIGSQMHFGILQKVGGVLPDNALNMDIFAYGSTLFTFASNPEGGLANALKNAAKGTPIDVRFIAEPEYSSGDHQSMASAGIETLGLALVDGAEIDQALKSGKPPRILTIIDTADDTRDKVRTQEIEKALKIVEKTIRLVDEKD